MHIYYIYYNNAINVKFNGKYVCISLFFVTGTIYYIFQFVCFSFSFLFFMCLAIQFYL